MQPDLPSAARTVDLRPMSQAEYDAWLEPSIVGYMQSWVDNGILTAEQARERADKDFRELLPDGLHTASNALWTAYDVDTPVGSLWVKFGLEMDPAAAFIYDIVVDENQRRRGYGRAMLQALVALVPDHGMTSIRLNVFGHNTGAIALYEEMGFVTTNMNMKLTL